MGERFAGYKMAACAIAICAGGIGLTYYALNLYLPSWVSDFGISLGEGSVAFSIIGVTTMLASFASSVIVGKIGLKRLFLAGIACVIAGYALFFAAPSILVVYAGGVFLGIGIAWAGMIPLGTIVPNWFVEKQGFMMGVVAASLGIDGLIANVAFSNLITALGWRPSALITIAVVAVLSIPAAVILKPSPEELGERPLGFEQLEQSESADVDSAAAYRKARKSASFWLLCVLVFCISSLITGMLPQVASIVTSHGFDLVFAGTVSGIMQIANVFGAFAMGIINDRCGLKGAFVYCLVIGATSMALVFACASALGCVAFAVMFGLGQAMLTTFYPLLIGPVFGSGASEQIVGFFNGVSGIAETIMPTVVGFSVTFAGTYNLAAAVEIVFIAVGVACGFAALKHAESTRAQNAPTPSD